MKTSFGNRFKELRQERNIGQRELAKPMGVGKGTISMWESGQREPILPYAVIAAKFFEVSLDYLAGLAEY